MLNQRKDITNATPPLLLTTPNNQWHLISKVNQTNSHNYLCTCIKKEDDHFTQYKHRLIETPFHIAEGIWELEYGVEIKTLLGKELANHPATQLWNEWCNNN